MVGRYFSRVMLVSMALFCFAVTGLCAEKTKVGIAYGFGGEISDYNMLGYKGALQAKSDLLGKLDVVISDPSKTGSAKATIEDLLRQKCNIIMLMGVGYEKILKEIAPLHSECQFITVDIVLPEPVDNTASLVFADREGAYLAGAAAALKSKSAKIGFVGAMQTPIIQEFEKGYIAGARAVNPKIEVHSGFIGNKPIAFKNASRARDLAYQQIDKGVDVIYTVAGFAGSGALEAVTEKGVLAIGVDVDIAKKANATQRRHLLTSTLKRVDVGVCQVIKVAANEDIRGRLFKLDLKDEGVDYAYNSYNEAQMADIKDQLALIKQDIISGNVIINQN